MIGDLFAFAFAAISVGICVFSFWNYLLRDRLRYQEKRMREIYGSLRYWQERAATLESRLRELENAHAADWWKEAE